MPMSWAWNLYGGWMKDMDFFDRGGELLIFGPASVTAAACAVIVGPRYVMGVSKKDRKKITETSAEKTAETMPQKIEKLLRLVRED
mmetsp:Transcript_43475/g.31744  ORF Transcript_43475/g.31744 Transcript_43475/m.31744 type:complete len:86 (-) Transcript_43475:834-1091(-)